MFHGDGVPCANDGSLEVLSWESISAKMGDSNITSSVDYIYYITGIFSQAFVSRDDSTKLGYVGRTKDSLWTPIIESFRYLEAGSWKFVLSKQRRL